MVRQNVTGLQWIASEAWTAAAVLQTPLLMPYLGGTLGIAIRRGEIPGLREFLTQIRPDRNAKNSGKNMVRVNSFALLMNMKRSYLMLSPPNIPGHTVLGAHIQMQIQPLRFNGKTMHWTRRH